MAAKHILEGFDYFGLVEKYGRMHEAFAAALDARWQRDLGAEFRAIRLIHELNEPSVAAGEYEPYIVDWTLLFSPIEHEAWHTIRACGLRMFPQYPVGRFFVDFGDPWTKRAIECDGKAYHDAARDARRDEELRALGWEVLRLPGSTLVRGEDDTRSADAAIREWFGLPTRAVREGCDA